MISTRLGSFDRTSLTCTKIWKKVQKKIKIKYTCNVFIWVYVIENIHSMCIYLISTLSVQFLLVFEPIHHLVHERQCNFPIFKFGTCIVILNRCNRRFDSLYKSLTINNNNDSYNVHTNLFWSLLTCNILQRLQLHFSILIFFNIFAQYDWLTHIFNVQGVNNRFLYLITGNGSLKSLLFHNLVTFQILHPCILVIRSNPHYLQPQEGNNMI